MPFSVEDRNAIKVFAVREWRKRLQACVAGNGEHFEHKL